MDDLNTKLSSFPEISKAQLSKILNSVSGTKDLTLEPELIRPLERICGVSWLKLNGVEKIFKLEPTAPKLPNTQFYMIYTDIKTFKTVLEIVQSQLDLENPAINKYHIICVPKVLYVFEDLLEELGLYHTVIKLYSLQWFPIYMDTSVISMEIPRLFSEFYIKQDYGLLGSCAKNLMYLESVFGGFKNVVALGACSSLVLGQYEQFYKGIVEETTPMFSALVLMDRTVDYPSVLLTPGTYSALLKEVYDVHCGVCQCVNKSDGDYDEKHNVKAKIQPVHFTLDSIKDPVYKDIKNRYFTEVTAILSTLTKQLRTEGERSKEMALDQIKTYVTTQLQAVTSKKKNISNHLMAAEAIINNIGHKFERQVEIERNIIRNKNKSETISYLEESLQTENDKYSSLTLMCLIAVTQKLSDGEIKSFLNKYFNEFGYDYGFIYRNLLKANIISEVSNSPITKINLKMSSLTNSSNFHTNAVRLKQIPPDPESINIKTPTCSSYVFGGSYVPLIAQISAMLISGTPIDDIKSKLSTMGVLEMRDNYYPLQNKSLLIYVIGGVTYSEIAALQLLEKLCGAKILVFSDKIVNGKDIVNALFTV